MLTCSFLIYNTNMKKINPKLLREYLKNPLKFRLEQWIMDNGQVLEKTVTDWQIKFILKPLDDPRYKLYYIQLPKKVGKSTFAAFEAVTRLFLEGLQDPTWEGYFLAGTEDQAKYLLDKAKKLIERNPNFKGVLVPQRERIIFPARRVELKILASEYKYTHQYNPNFFVFDEFWNQPDDKLFTSIYASMVKPRSKGLIITNAGEVKMGICWEIRQKCRKNRPYNWYYYEPTDIHINPILKPHWIDDSWLESQRTTLSESEFNRLILNQWGDKKPDEIKFLPDEVIESAIDDNLEWGIKEVDPESIYILSVDIGVANDKTVALLMKFKDNECTLEDLKLWRGSKFKNVEIKEVEEYILRVEEKYKNRLVITGDTWQAVYLFQRLKDKGLKVIEVYLQNLQPKLATLMKDAFLNERIKFPYHEILIWELKHSMIDTSEKLNLARIKRTYGKRSLDIVFAIGMGLITYERIRTGEVYLEFVSSSSFFKDKSSLPRHFGKRKIQIEEPLVEISQRRSSFQYWKVF